MSEILETLLGRLRAAAQRTRLRLLAICSEGEMTVGEIAEVIGQSQPRVSRHLKLLCEAGLLYRFREQHWVFYRVPLKGEGADLVRSLLCLIDPEDDVITLDHQRTEAVKAKRAERAMRLLDEIDEGTRGRQPVDERAIGEAILELVGTRGIGDLLDIGTGTGRILKLLGPRADAAVGIDISSEMRLVARANLHAAGLDHCMIRYGNMYKLPFPNESFATVTIDQVLYQAEDPAAAVAEAARLLQNQGRLLVVEAVKDEVLRDWLNAARLRPESTRRVSGGPGAMTVFLARKAAATSEAAA